METPIGTTTTTATWATSSRTVPTTAPIEAAMQASLRDVVKDILDGLTPAKPGAAHALRHRNDQRPHLEEVGKQFDVTRERIRQIEAKALRKLICAWRWRHRDRYGHPLEAKCTPALDR